MLTNRCGCCQSCDFCTEEPAEGNVTVQAGLTLTNDTCTGAKPSGLDCTTLDGTFVLTQQAAVSYPGAGDAESGTTGEGNACYWRYTSPTPTDCTTDDCEDCTCDASCPDDGNTCDPLVSADCDGNECTAGAEGPTCTDCGNPVDCIRGSNSIGPADPADRCECVEDPPASAIFVCDCAAATCTTSYTCGASAVVDVYLYSADGNTKRVLYVVVTLEGETYHGAEVYATDTLDCRDDIASQAVTLANITAPNGFDKLCSVPTTITISFI